MNAKSLLSNWPSAWVFVLAAVGSAAGLGNVWRFPYLAYDNGGAAFFVAYIICLILIGFPILLTENAMGQQTQKAAPEAMASIDYRATYRFIGLWGALAAVIVMSYYAVVMSWSGSYLFSAPSLAWADDASGYYYNTILNLSDNVREWGSLAPHLLAGLAVVWLVIYLSLFRGMQSIAKVVSWITPLAFLLLFVLAGNGLFLPNAGEGLRYFFVPQWGALLDLSLWIAAVSQVFFTLTLGFGVMFAYGALLKKSTDLVRAAKYVVLGDTIVAFIAGVVIFSTIGYMAGQQGVTIEEVVASGPGLVFVVFPEALTLLPVLPSLFAIAFFVILLSLALTSAISLVQSVVSVLVDYFPQASYERIVRRVCVAFFFLSLPYAFSNGLYLLDIVDHFIVNYGIVLVGFVEVVVLAWVYGAHKLREAVNRHAKPKLGRWYEFALRFVIPIALGVLLATSAAEDLTSRYGDYTVSALVGYGVIPALTALLLAAILATFIAQKKADNAAS